MLIKSKFNTLFDDKDSYIIFNSLTYNKCTISKKLYDNISLLNDKEKTLLYSKGFLISNLVDENNIIEHIINKSKYSNNTLAFIYLPTFNCNLNCSYCYQKNYECDKSFKRTPSEIAKWIFSQLKKDTEKVVLQYYGGEPLLEKNRILELNSLLSTLFKEYNIEFHIDMCTNGYFLDLNFITQLQKTSIIDRIQITIHDMELLMNKYHETVISNIKNFSSSNVPISIRFDLNKINHSYILKIMQYIPKADNISIVLAPIYPWNNESRNSSELYTENDVQEVINLREKIHKMGYKVLKKLNYTCKMIMYNCVFVIDPQGYIYKCDAMAGQKQYSIGNIDTFSTFNTQPNYKQIMFESIWNMPSKCKTCDVMPMCMSGCKYRNYFQKNPVNFCYRNSILEEINLLLLTSDESDLILIS